MYWLSSWDNPHFFSKYFTEDMFIRSFFDEMFDRKISAHHIFSKSNNRNLRIDLFYNRYDIFMIEDIAFKNIPRFLKRFYKIPYYWSKIRIIRFNKWLIIYLYIYSTNRSVDGSYFFKKIYKQLYKYNKVYIRNLLLNDMFYEF